MKLFGELISFETAREFIERHVLPVERTRSLKIDDALGCVLAEDIIARHYTPPFNRAAMDGYAVKSKDTVGASKQNPKKLNLVGTLYAGSTINGELSAGESIQISTGAPMPAGADAVVMLENTEHTDNIVSIFKSASPLSNVALKGEDIKRGEIVLKRGMHLGAGKIGVLASQGSRRCMVYEKPAVAILPTGEEIVETGRRLKAGQIYDINSHTLSAVVKGNGGLPVIFSTTGDNTESIKANLDKALDNADLVVISGGSSVGEKDLIIDVLEERGKVFFHGINIKPGKPTAFAIVKGKPVLCMPGYPTSCLINAYLLLGPAIRRMAHLPPGRSFSIQAKMGARVTGGNGRRLSLPVRLEGETAYPILKGSGAITGTAQADGYITVDEDKAYLEKDSLVKVILF
ncbi:gephyrin-like molybdotransferase Glp [Chloroflexota bacterium]